MGGQPLRKGSLEKIPIGISSWSGSAPHGVVLQHQMQNLLIGSPHSVPAQAANAAQGFFNAILHQSVAVGKHVALLCQLVPQQRGVYSRGDFGRAGGLPEMLPSVLMTVFPITWSLRPSRKAIPAPQPHAAPTTPQKADRRPMLLF